MVGYLTKLKVKTTYTFKQTEDVKCSAEEPLSTKWVVLVAETKRCFFVMVYFSKTCMVITLRSTGKVQIKDRIGVFSFYHIHCLHAFATVLADHCSICFQNILKNSKAAMTILFSKDRTSRLRPACKFESTIYLSKPF